MRNSIHRSLGIAGLLGLLLGGCASAPPAAKTHSGFLGDYSLLKETTDSQGDKLMRGFNPRFDPKAYRGMILEPVSFYPEPKASNDVSHETLTALRDYMNTHARERLGAAGMVTNKAAPGILRLRVAITSVGTEDASLEPYQYIPIAFVISAASDAATGKTQEAALFVEVDVSDSMTGERMFASVRSGRGEKLAKTSDSSGKVTVDALKPLLDKWLDNAIKEMPTFIQGH